MFSYPTAEIKEMKAMSVIRHFPLLKSNIGPGHV